jgi:hypothetical protein
MPLLVYAVGTLLGTEILSRRVGCILFVVVTGVLVASYGELTCLLLLNANRFVVECKPHIDVGTMHPR